MDHHIIAAPRPGIGQQGFSGVRRRDVQQQRLDPDLRRQIGQTHLRPRQIQRRDARALGGEQADDGLAYALRRAGDQHTPSDMTQSIRRRRNGGRHADRLTRDIGRTRRQQEGQGAFGRILCTRIDIDHVHADAAPRLLGQRADKTLQTALDRLALSVRHSVRRGSDDDDPSMFGHRPHRLMEEAIQGLHRCGVSAGRGVEHQCAVTHIRRPVGMDHLRVGGGKTGQDCRHPPFSIAAQQQRPEDARPRIRPSLQRRGARQAQTSRQPSSDAGVGEIQIAIAHQAAFFFVLTGARAASRRARPAAMSKSAGKSSTWIA